MIFVKTEVPLCRFPSRSSGTEVGKTPETHVLPPRFYPSAPLSVGVCYACGPACVPAAPASVAVVFPARHRSQVGNAIVGTDAIDVINVFGRPFAVVQRPRHAVREKLTPVYRPGQIAPFHGCERDPPSEAAIPLPKLRHSRVSRKPVKIPGFRVVAQQLAHECCRRYVCFSQHSVLPHVCGQGRALLTQRFRSASHSTGALSHQ